MSNDKTHEQQTATPAGDVLGNPPAFTLMQLQSEAAAWSLHNFGKRPASQPLRGIIEELGELEQSYLRGVEKREHVIDALADTVIFMADYCTCMGIDMRMILWAPTKPEMMTPTGPDWGHVLRVVGVLCHHDLKLEQKIRLNQDHEGHILLSLSAIYGFLEQVAKSLGTNLLNETYEVWQKVKQRDWKKNAVTGM